MTHAFAQALQRSLADVAFVRRFCFYETTTSTMDDARRHIQDVGAAHADGTVFVTEQQTAGRGRRGRAWHATPGSALLFSVVVAEAEGITAPLWPLCMGIAAARATRAAASDDTIALKYPNDLLRKGRKLGGMLVEAVEAQGRAAMIGVGINTSEPAGDWPSELKDLSSSLEFPSGDHAARAQLLAGILTSFSKQMHSEASRTIAEYSALCSTLGNPMRIVTESGEIEGTALGLDESGGLIVQEISGTQRVVLTGDIQHLRVTA